MSKKKIIFFSKITLLSLFLVLIFNIGDNYINANSSEKKVVNSNNYSNFKTVNNNNFGKIGVAIATNIGSKLNQRNQLPANIYKDVFSVSEVINNKQEVNGELISNNMLAIQEYKNILQTDIKKLLDSSYDRKVVLEAFISQLEYRYDLGKKNFNKLNNQKSVFVESMNSANSKIEQLKGKIDRDFKKNDAKESLENIEKYIQYKKEYSYSKAYILYINQFLVRYNYLINYNKILLDTLTVNKDIIVKESYIVIPESGTKLLKEFNLLYTEKEFKSK